MLIVATGNENKFYEASKICEGLGIQIEQAKLNIDEIQHHDAGAITEAKVKSAYAILKQPVVVNDSYWEIPALGGFPGAYMKDVAGWLSTQDFLNLMKDKNDKSILLNECVAFYDGETLQLFFHKRPGHFIDTPRGKSDPSFARVVEIEGDGMTISEVFDGGEWSVTNDRHKHWYDFAKWYKEIYMNK